jgi:hypothetical protein
MVLSNFEYEYEETIVKIEFHYYSPQARIPHISTSFTRDVEALPRVGDRIVRHMEGRSTDFEVKEILHVFEDRDSYKGKDYGGDRICVCLLPLSREQVSIEFRKLLEESGVRSSKESLEVASAS